MRVNVINIEKLYEATMKLKRNMTTERNREFWSFVDRAANEVKNWPDWKRTGIGVTWPDRRDISVSLLEDKNEVSETGNK